MKSKKEAERAEQQRIKNLVLNYDLQDSAEQDGIDTDLNYFSRSNPNLPKDYFTADAPEAHNGKQGYVAEKHAHNASLHTPSSNHANARPADRSGGNRGGQRARKLQLSDVDWYATSDRPRGRPPSSSQWGGGRARGRRLQHKETS